MWTAVQHARTATKQGVLPILHGVLLCFVIVYVQSVRAWAMQGG